MISITQCEICSEFRGTIVSDSSPSQATIGYCRCQPVGWEICRRHAGNVRRRHATVKILNLKGEYGYFSVYSMMAPCREDTCFTPAPEFWQQIVSRLQKLNEANVR
jgi:hypothetical protein